MAQNVRVMLVDDGLWHVKRGTAQAVDLAFHHKVCALAFAKALAYRTQSNLYLHHPDGDVIRQPKASLTYPQGLE